VTRGAAWVAAFLALATAITGCQERLTAPAECPELCPGGESRMLDTTLTPLSGSDTSYVGFVGRQSAASLLSSNGLPASEDRAVYRFNVRGDSIEVRDTLRAYTIDSVVLGLTLAARDTLVNGLKLYLYRIDPSVDINTTFTAIEQQLVPEAIIDSIAVPDTLNAGAVQTVLTGAELAKVALPPGDSAVLALAVAISAAEPTGVRLGSAAGGAGARFATHATVDVPDTGAVRRQTISPPLAFNAFVTAAPLVPDPNFLTVGGEPSSRALVRFDLPPSIEDSGTIVRATLELIPREPILGLRGDPARLQAAALLADIGAKSPITSDARFITTGTLEVGSADTVRLDVTSIVQLWQTTTRPEAVFLSLQPEGGSFSRPAFGSTRSGTVGAPRLRLTYLRPFPFENP
jgi:hypothetical protein